MPTRATHRTPRAARRADTTLTRAAFFDGFTGQLVTRTRAMVSDTTWMGFILMVLGTLVSMTVVGAIVGIPMFVVGCLLIGWRWFRWPFAKLWGVLADDPTADETPQD